MRTLNTTVLRTKEFTVQIEGEWITVFQFDSEGCRILTSLTMDDCFVEDLVLFLNRYADDEQERAA